MIKSCVYKLISQYPSIQVKHKHPLQNRRTKEKGIQVLTEEFAFHIDNTNTKDNLFLPHLGSMSPNSFHENLKYTS